MLDPDMNEELQEKVTAMMKTLNRLKSIVEHFIHIPYLKMISLQA
jgi:hypothetical protein